MNINRDKARNAIYSAAGIYMLYTAWMLYGDLDEADGDGMLFLVFTIVFAVAGIALIALGIWNLYKENTKTASHSESDKETSSEEDQTETESAEETESLTETESTEGTESKTEEEPAEGVEDQTETESAAANAATASGTEK